MEPVKVGSAGNAGQPGTGSTDCLAQKTADGSFILPTVPPIPNTGTIAASAHCKSFGYRSRCGRTCPFKAMILNLYRIRNTACIAGEPYNGEANRPCLIHPNVSTVPANKDGSCPAGSHEVGGALGSAGQPGTGFVSCISDKPTTTTPATPATTTPIPVSAGMHFIPTTR